MDLTIHGIERIYGRTKMRIEDVLLIISGGAAVDLGVDAGERYFLFYSPFNRCSKVAVVSRDGTRLISVWEKNFTLPKGITQVTKALERRAQAKLRDFIFARIKKNSPPVAK